MLLQESCATHNAQAPGPEPFCQADDIRIRTDFEGASLHACAQDEGRIVLTVAPEYAPINPSSWYAYRLLPAAAGTVRIRQRYLHGQHRYHPWISRDGDHWEKLPLDRAAVGTDGAVELSVDLPAEGLYVAAQPILSNADMDAWMLPLAKKNRLGSARVARTVGGRPVTAYQSTARQPRGLVVLISRQHPPEVTGGLAFQDFVDRIFSPDKLAVRFRSEFMIGLVPGVNPDGVARGYWRTNLRGVDLNRDWGPFTQPETRGIANWLDDLNTKTPLLLFLDFHSTLIDVLYTQHESDDPVPAGFATAWREKMTARLGNDMPEWSTIHNAGLPTAKSWVRKTYGVTAMTYEVADTTPRESIRHKAVAAAEEMMKLMLDLEDTSL